MPTENRLLYDHPIDVGLVRRDLMHLACLYLAEPIITEKMQSEKKPLPRDDSSYPFFPLDGLMKEFKESETRRMLLHVAAALRIIDDNAPQDSVLRKGFRGISVGRMVNYNDAPLQEAYELLYLRKACSKILHARAIHFNYRWHEEPPLDGWLLNTIHPQPIIVLAGDEWIQETKTKIEWIAGIDTINFVKLAAAMTAVYRRLKADGHRRQRAEKTEAQDATQFLTSTPRPDGQATH